MEANEFAFLDNGGGQDLLKMKSCYKNAFVCF